LGSTDNVAALAPLAADMMTQNEAAVTMSLCMAFPSSIEYDDVPAEQ
jgi:hypothetical protein